MRFLKLNFIYHDFHKSDSTFSSRAFISKLILGHPESRLLIKEFTQIVRYVWPFGCIAINQDNGQDESLLTSAHPEMVFLPDLGVMLKKIILGISL